MSLPLTEASFVAQAMALADTALFPRAEHIKWSMTALGRPAGHYWSEDLHEALQIRCDHARDRVLIAQVEAP